MLRTIPAGNNLTTGKRNLRRRRVDCAGTRRLVRQSERQRGEQWSGEESAPRLTNLMIRKEAARREYPAQDIRLIHLSLLILLGQQMDDARFHKQLLARGCGNCVAFALAIARETVDVLVFVAIAAFEKLPTSTARTNIRSAPR